MIKIKIYGTGGQGIVFIGWLLGYAATLKNIRATVHHSYGAEVRGGAVESSVLISKNSYKSPYFIDPDLSLILHYFGWSKAFNTKSKKYIADDHTAGIEVNHEKFHIDWKPFSAVAHKYSVNVNIVALGYLIKHIKYLSLDDMINAISKAGRDVNMNIRGLKLGYKL